METGERASLVAGHSMYTEEGGKEGNQPEPEPPSKDNVLGQFHQDALTQVGVGSYQVLVCGACGLCFMTDGAQIFLTPYLAPSIEAEMCLDEYDTYWLYGITFVGLMVGTLLCPLADHIGRKSLLIFALAIHLAFNIATAFTPSFGLFLFSRFGAYLGMGMLLPISCILFAEYLPLNARYRISILLLFWTFGGFFSLLLSYFFLPGTGLEVVEESKDHHNGWHKVVLLSSLPAVSGLALLVYTAESVRYLLHDGKDVNAIIIYQQMYKWNATRCAQYQLTELELPSKPVCQKQPPAKSVWSQVKYNISMFFDSLKELGHCSNLRSLILLSIIWSALGFSYHGLAVWAPGRIQALKDSEYNSQMQSYQNIEFVGHLFETDMENILYVNVTFTSSTFAHIKMSHVTFDHCTFRSVEFTNILSSKTYFIYSVIEDSRFADTNLTPDRFINCQMENNTEVSMEPECRDDVDFNYKQKEVMQENVLRLACPLFALLLNCTCFKNFRRSRVGVAAMFVCGLSTLAVCLVRTERAILVFDMIWSLIFIFAFNTTNIVTVESFPVNLRATGFGLCFLWFRIFGLYGFSMFEENITSPRLPAGVTITALLVATTSLLKLHETSNNLM